MSILPNIFVAMGILVGATSLVAAWQIRREGDDRAAGRMLGLAPWLTAPWLVAGLVAAPWATWLGVVLLTALGILLLLVLPPWGRSAPAPDPGGPACLDERDTMFSRAEISPGSDRFDAYYDRRPASREPDDAWRERPGLLSPDAALHDPIQFGAAEATFETVTALHPLVEGEPAAERRELDPAAASRFLTHWARKLGARDARVTELRPHHCYTVGGRGDRYDEPVDLDHGWALALTVEMDKEAVDHAPAGPVVMESAQQYLASGAIAVQLAILIRRLGWRARAHIDGNYQVCCPLVARDAGLGEIGRMGLLMTPDLGPRVRLAVVTCDLPLAASARRGDATVADFCRLCEKCADVCPSAAIPRGEAVEVDGVRRWQIDQVACFGLWCEVGTDCARCVQSCPYSHSDSWLHRPVRWLIGRSRPARWLALRADDLVYGRRPASREVADWRRTG